jgi:hypothetical protein
MHTQGETISIKKASEILGITVREFIVRMSVIGKRFNESDFVPVAIVGLAERGIQRDMQLHEKLKDALKETSKTKRKQKVKESMELPLDFLPIEEANKLHEEIEHEKVNDIRLPDNDIEPE